MERLADSPAAGRDFRADGPSVPGQEVDFGGGEAALRRLLAGRHVDHEPAALDAGVLRGRPDKRRLRAEAVEFVEADDRHAKRFGGGEDGFEVGARHAHAFGGFADAVGIQDEDGVRRGDAGQHGGDFRAAAPVLRTDAEAGQVAARRRFGDGEGAGEVAAAAKAVEVAQEKGVRLRRVAAHRIGEGAHGEAGRAAGRELRLDLVGEVSVFAEFRDDVRRDLVLKAVQADGMAGFGEFAQRGGRTVVDVVVGEEGRVRAVRGENRQGRLPVGEAAVVEREAQDAIRRRGRRHGGGKDQ